MKLININGISKPQCKCGNWLEHWKKFTGMPVPVYCSSKACTRRPTAGTHVQLADSDDEKWYIVPLCTEHNLRTSGSVEINDWIPLVPAMENEMCGYERKSSQF